MQFSSLLLSLLGILFLCLAAIAAALPNFSGAACL